MGETFGAHLRNERRQAGHTLRKLSQATNIAVSTLSRWENDRNVPARTDVTNLDKALKSDTRLLRLWESATSRGIPPWMRSPGALEERAAAIDTVSVNLVPGLLQSPGYARAVFRAFHLTAPDDEIERLAQLRISRYEALKRRTDPLVTVVFPLHPLKSLPTEIKHEQAKYLLQHLERGRLVVYIIPEYTPVLATSSSVQLYRLRDGAVVAASDHARGNVILDKPADTASIESLVRDLIGLALPRSESGPVLEGMLDG